MDLSHLPPPPGTKRKSDAEETPQIERLDLSHLPPPPGNSTSALTTSDQTPPDLAHLPPPPPTPQLSQREEGGQSEEISDLESAAIGAVQSASFEFADEIYGTVKSALSNVSYTQARNEYRDYVKTASTANPMAYIGGQVVGGIGVSFVPGLGWMNAGKTVASAAKIGAASGAIYGAGMAKEMKDVPQDVAMGAAGGAAIGGLMAGAFRYFSKAKAPDSVKRYAFRAEEENIFNGVPTPDAVREETVNALAEMDKSFKIMERVQIAAQKHIDAGWEGATKNTQNTFLKELAGVPRNQKLTPGLRRRAEEIIARSPDSLIQQKWTNFALTNYGRPIVSRQLKKQVQEMSSDKSLQEMGMIKRYFSAPSQVAQDTDEITGLGFESAVSGMHTATNRIENDMLGPVNKLTKIYSRLKKDTTDPTSIGRLMAQPKSQRLKDPTYQALKPSQKQAMNDLDSWFRDSKALLESYGYKIPDLYGDAAEGYFPSLTVDVAEQHRVLSSLVKQADTFDPNSQLGRAVQLLPGGKDVQNLTQARNVINNLTARSGFKEASARLNKQAGAIIDRTDTIPDLIRDYDPFKVALRYIQGNLKAIHIQPHIDELRTNIQLARGAGLTDTANYFEKYVKDQINNTSSFYAFLRTSGMKIQDYGTKQFGPIEQLTGLKKLTAQSFQAFPEMIDWTTTLIYPNVMGANIHAPLRNMTQTWVLTAPEIQASFNPNSYGYKAVARGWTAGAKNFKERVAKMKSKGLLVDRPTFESGRQVLSSEMDKMVGVGTFRRAVDKWNDVTMSLYSLSDTANRVFAYAAGEQVADDLLRGSQDAFKFVNRLSGTMRREIIAALEAKQDEKVRELIGGYLVRKTQFNYGRADLSEFGRTFGRVGSMFTKWPTMVIGDIESAVRKGEGSRALRKYLGPLVLAGTAQATLTQMEAFDSPVVRTLFGKSVMSWSPATSVMGLQTPALLAAGQGTIEAAKAAAQLELRSAESKLAKELTPFMPLWGQASTVYNRYDDLLEGDK